MLGETRTGLILSKKSNELVFFDVTFLTPRFFLSSARVICDHVHWLVRTWIWKRPFFLRSPCSDCRLNNRGLLLLGRLQTDFGQVNVPTSEAFPWHHPPKRYIISNLFSSNIKWVNLSMQECKTKFLFTVKLFVSNPSSVCFAWPRVMFCACCWLQRSGMGTQGGQGPCPSMVHICRGCSRWCQI